MFIIKNINKYIVAVSALIYVNNINSTNATKNNFTVCVYEYNGEKNPDSLLKSIEYDPIKNFRFIKKYSKRVDDTYNNLESLLDDKKYSICVTGCVNNKDKFIPQVVINNSNKAINEYSGLADIIKKNGIIFLFCAKKELVAAKLKYPAEENKKFE